MLALYPLQISPGAIGQDFKMGSQPFTPVGGVAPYTWAVTGNLPVGLDLNTAIGGTNQTSAVLEGTPRVADQYDYKPTTAIPFVVNPSTFTLTVTDSTGATASQTYTMPIGVFSERQGISIFEMLDAVYGVDYYVVMSAIGTRMMRIGDIGSPAFGGIRLIVNALLANFTQGMIEVMLEHIAEWDEIKDNWVDQEQGSVSDLTGLSNIIGKKKAGLLNRVKKLLPAYTLAEIRAREAKGGGDDSTGPVTSGKGGGYVEFIR